MRQRSENKDRAVFLSVSLHLTQTSISQDLSLIIYQDFQRMKYL